MASLLSRKDWFLHRSNDRRRPQTEVPSAGSDVLLSSGFIAGNSSTSCGRTITNGRSFIFPHLVSASLISMFCHHKVLTSRLTNNFPHFLHVKQIHRVVMCHKGCGAPVVTDPSSSTCNHRSVFLQVCLVPRLNL